MYNDLIEILNKKSEKPFYELIYTYFKSAIFTSKLKSDEKMPSIRLLAKTVNKSINTVKLAYEQLLLEGFIYSRIKSGYYVSEIETQKIQSQEILEHILEEKELKYNLSQSSIDQESFPEKKWLACLNNRFNKNIVQYGNWKGEFELREEITKYLFKSRSVYTKPENIIIASGTQTMILQFAAIVGKSSIIFEEPGYDGARKIFQQLGWDLMITHLSDSGINISELKKKKADFIYTTPSHQYPTGIVYSIKNRQSLVSWANENDSYIIEDDYDSEFRFVHNPIPAIQSLDPSRVIYISTFSKSFMPSMRLAFIVLPDKLLKCFEKLQLEQTVSRHHQLAFAKFINDGDWERHLRKMRKTYKEKHDYFIRVFKETFPKATIDSDDAGLRFKITFKTLKTESWFIEKANTLDISIKSLEISYINKAKTDSVSLLIGFGSVKLNDIEKVVEMLKKVWNQ